MKLLEFSTVFVQFYIISLSYCAVVEVSNEGVLNPNAGFRQFVTEAMEGYPKWLKENDFDPTPNEPEPTILRIDNYNNPIKMELELSESTVEGISRNIEVTEVAARFDFRSLKVGVLFENGITFQGNYKINGSLFGCVPLEGSGRWKIVARGLRQSLDFTSFKETEDGYIDLTNSHTRLTFSNLVNVTHLKFDNLNAGGFEDFVEDGILTEFKRYFQYWFPNREYGYPAAKLIHHYLIDVVEAVPITEIIETPVPTTTPRPTTTTTKSPPPTTTPNPCTFVYRSDHIEEEFRFPEFMLETLREEWWKQSGKVGRNVRVARESME